VTGKEIGEQEMEELVPADTYRDVVTSLKSDSLRKDNASASSSNQDLGWVT